MPRTAEDRARLVEGGNLQQRYDGQQSMDTSEDCCTSKCESRASTIVKSFIAAAALSGVGYGIYTGIKKNSDHHSDVCQNFVPTSGYQDCSLQVEWDQATDSLQPVAFPVVPNLNIVASFITAANNNCTAAFGGVAEYAPPFGQPVIKAFQQQGGSVVISFGGAAGTYLHDVCSEAELAAQIQNVMDTYGVSSLDFDIEGAALGNLASIQKLASVLAQFQQNNKTLQISLTLPVATTGLTAVGLNAVQAFKNAGLVFKTNIMAMDYGDCQDMGQGAIDAANATVAQLQTIYPDVSAADLFKRLIVTPMIGVNDDANGASNTEVFTVANANTLSAFCKLNGCQLRYWSLNRDNSGDDLHSNFNSGAVNGVPVQASDFAFAQEFLSCAQASANKSSLFAVPVSNVTASDALTSRLVI